MFWWVRLTLRSIDNLTVGQEFKLGRLCLGRLGFSFAAYILEVAAIVAVSVIAGVAYYTTAYGEAGNIKSYVALGGLAALVYSLLRLFREDYRIEAYLEGSRDLGRTFVIWNTAILSLVVIGVLTKSNEQVSSAALLLLYVGGLVTLTGLTALTRAVLISLIASGRVACRRVMIVGAEDEVRNIQAEFLNSPVGARVVATHVLPFLSGVRSSANLSHLLKLCLQDAIQKARVVDVDDVILVADWSRMYLINEIIEGFRVMPVAVHVAGPGLLGHYSDARVTRFSTVTTLSLTAPPLGSMQLAVKRAFDLSVALPALILLTPLFALIAVAVKTTSPGPVFFRQRRRGYNSREFRIWKFRTMTTLDDGPVIVQAKANDERVTAVGSFLRRLNLDELPQLFNVISGEMSLVGPRPHAVAHDRYFEDKIGSYPRRLSLKPGITGWAQVKGCRGSTDTVDKMRARVEYDLYYIDNWSIMFDLYILFLTGCSPKAYRNAY